MLETCLVGWMGNFGPLPIFTCALTLTVKMMEAVTDAGMTQVEEQVVVETVAVAAAASIPDQELAPPAPPKKRLVETDAEVRRM